jgi:O-antigen/teichoic acid export membrane protein
VSVPIPGTNAEVWGDDGRMVAHVAHNVSTRYLAYLVDAVLGLVMLPFNLAHLGMAAYGLWAFTTSLTVYFSMLDLGYGGSLVRFVAQYRARRDARSLNEVLSTLSVVYTVIAAVTYLGVVLIALNLDAITRLTPAEAATCRMLLLIVGVNVALRFVFGIYGGVIVGFQRYHLNNLTSIATSLVVSVANVVVLLMGYGVVELVAATTAVRVLALLVYRMNAYRVFPSLSVDWRQFRIERLREISGFSVFMLLLDGAYKVNYSTDVLVIGALLGAPAVALWAPAQRLCEVTLRLSNQVSEALFPIVVDCDETQRAERLRRILVQGTRLSLATVLPIAGSVVLLAHPLLAAWIGPSFAETATIVQILATVVIVRVGSSTASVVLKGSGLHRTLTALVSVMAVANIALSIALIRPLGLMGVALGTLMPVAAVALLGLVPTAARRVNMSLVQLFRDAIWPALWPAVIAACLLLFTRDHLPARLPSLALQIAVGAAAYVSMFLLAVGAEGRREYMRHANVLLKRPSRQMSQIGTANAS